MDKLQPRWHEATNELIEQLKKRGVKLHNLKALEVFGGKGDWQTSLFYEKVKSLEVWEINQEYKKDLKKNLPNAIIKIQNSIETLKENENLPKFDLIIIDNPMNVFGSIDEKNNNFSYCEHFDIMKNIQKIIGSKTILIFNVNRNPFNYTNNKAWRLRREKFYKTKNSGNMPIDFLLNFYKEFFRRLGFQTEFCFNIIRVFYEKKDMTHYFVYKIKKMEI